MEFLLSQTQCLPRGRARRVPRAQNYLPSTGQFESIPIELGDFTGDGNIDIAVGLGLFRGNGDGTFSDFEPGPGGSTTTTGDFNHDGWLDIASVGYGAVWVHLNNGDWEPADPNPLPGDYNGNSTVDAADYTVWRVSLGRSDLVPYSGAGR